jgi:two-component system OmpR family response regulator
MHESDEKSMRGVAPYWQPSAPARIVVVENDDAHRNLVIAKLLNDGHEVHGASSASGLLRLLADGGATIPPLDGADLIVLDQQLPGRSGIEIIRRLRSARSKIPLLLMASRPTSALAQETKRFRVPILEKPFSLSDLSHAALLLLITRMSSAEAVRPTAPI